MSFGSDLLQSADLLSSPAVGKNIVARVPGVFCNIFYEHVLAIYWGAC